MRALTQHVQGAYEILGDEAQRRGYDREKGNSTSGSCAASYPLRSLGMHTLIGSSFGIVLAAAATAIYLIHGVTIERELMQLLMAFKGSRL